LTAGEFFSGKEPTLKLVSLEDGTVSTSTAVPQRAPTLVESPIVSRSTSLATPVSAAPAPAPAPAPEVREPISARQETTFSPPPVIPLPSPNTTEEAATLRDENSKLNSELREARAQIRNLELQLEAVRANARKAAQLLSNTD
jgi:coronin-1B/1C/6